jgi:hypothetical protein
MENNKDGKKLKDCNTINKCNYYRYMGEMNLKKIHLNFLLLKWTNLLYSLDLKILDFRILLVYKEYKVIQLHMMWQFLVQFV